MILAETGNWASQSIQMILTSSQEFFTFYAILLFTYSQSWLKDYLTVLDFMPTGWFNLILAIIVLILIIGLHKRRTRMLKLHKAQLEQTVYERNAELRSLVEQLNGQNSNLEMRVVERTRELELKNTQLAEYAFINTHNLRRPVANIKGLIQLFDYELSPEEIKEIISNLRNVSEEIDEVLHAITEKLEKDELLQVVHRRPA